MCNDDNVQKILIKNTEKSAHQPQTNIRANVTNN